MLDHLVVPTLFQPDVAETFGPPNPPQSKEIDPNARGVRLQLLTVQVDAGLDGLLGRPAAAGVYVVSSVADGVGAEPITFAGKVYGGIKNGDPLPFGPGVAAGEVLNVYLRDSQIPRLLSFNLLVIRSHAQLRELGHVLTSVMSDERFRKLSTIVSDAVSAANPAYSVVAQAGQEAMAILAEILASKPDDRLAYYQANFTNLFDDLGVGRHPRDKPTFSVDKIRLAYQVDVG